MNVRAKFKVESILHGESQSDAVNQTVKLRAVTGGDGRGNESWSKWTPSGELTMRITNPAAAEQFKVGAFVYLDFTPAPAAEP